MFEPRLVDWLAIPLLFLDKSMRTLEADDQRIEFTLRRHGFERLHSQNKINEVQRFVVCQFEHRFDNIISQPIDDPAIVTNPLKNEFRYPAPSLLLGAWSPLKAIADDQVSRIINVEPQVHAQVSLKNNPDDGRGIPTQSKGVFRSGRHETHMEECHHRIQPVGQRQHLTTYSPWQFSFDRPRQI